MEVQNLLVNSVYCRLCGEENKNGTPLFPAEETGQDLSQLVNKYLPLKVFNDGKLPTTICPGCHIQLEASIQFLDLIISGQTKIRHLWRIQQETVRKLEKEKKQKELILNSALSNGSETIVLQTEENGENIYIQVFSEGSLFPTDHEMSLRVEGLERPKRKRGRPPKPPPKEETSLIQLEDKSEAQEAEEEIEEDADGRKRRRIKVPTRFKEAVQGKELERIFREEGVIGEEESSSEEEEEEDAGMPSLNEPEDEIIGHLENQEGEDLGELIIANKNKKVGRQRGKRKKKFDCEICNRSFLHYGRFVAHRSLHKDVKFECCTCKDQFTNRELLDEHQKCEDHSGEIVVEKLGSDYEIKQEEDVSKECGSSTEQTQQEIAEGTSDTSYSDSIEFACKLCDKSFMSKQSFDIHSKVVHEGQKPFACDKCSKSFSYPATLKAHMEQQHQHVVKTDKGYSCDVCNKHFNHPSSIIYHKESEHNNGRRFVCNKCDKSFKHKQLLQRHQLVHSDSRPYACKSCGATFKTRANLINHQPTHTGEKKYFCTLCGQQFAHKTSLTLHYRWHDGQKPYECNICNKSFSQKGNLQEHKRIHTGEKPFCCDHCGRKFTTSSQFKLHVKRHTGERPWRCDFCGKTFLHKDTWKCHTRRHRNERPYKCATCTRGFTEQWALKKHMRLHTGEKPYVCDVCEKAFADCSNLTKHKKIHWGSDSLRKTTTTTLQAIQSNGENHYVYVTYQDTNSNDGQTLVHFLEADDADEAAAEEQLGDKRAGASEPASSSSHQLGLDYSLLQSVVDSAAANSVPNLDDDDEFQDAVLKNAADAAEGVDDDEMELGDGYVQVTDHDGNPINITTNDGRQIKVITSDGQNYNALMADGTVHPIGYTQDGKVYSFQLLTGENAEEEDAIGAMTLPEDGDDLAAVADLPDDTHFVTDDGQSVCLITSYNIEDDTMPSEYLSIN